MWLRIQTNGALLWTRNEFSGSINARDSLSSWKIVSFRDRRLPLRMNWILPPSGLLGGMRLFETDVSGITVSRIFKSQAVQEARPLKMRPTALESSISNHLTPRNNPEDGRIQLLAPLKGLVFCDMMHTLVKIYGRFGQNSCLRLQEDRKPPRLAARRVDRRVQPTSSQPDQNWVVCPIFKARCTDWFLLFRCCLSFTFKPRGQRQTPVRGHVISRRFTNCTVYW
jgi:hypothetical protein